MPALANEPWRGRTRVVVNEGLSRVTVQVDAEGNGLFSGHAGTWSGAAGQSFTLTMAVSSENSLLNSYTAVRVEAFIPGGASFGTAAWTPPVWANGSSAVPVYATQSFRFDSNPLNNSAADAIRAGAIEIVVTLERSGQATNNHTINSRGETTGTAPAGTTFDWARGWFRASNTVASVTQSRTAFGGTPHTSFAFGDPIFNRITYTAQWWPGSSVNTTFAHLTEVGGFGRGATGSASTGTQIDLQFSGTGSRTDRRVDLASGPSSTQYRAQADLIRQRVAVNDVRFPTGGPEMMYVLVPGNGFTQVMSAPNIVENTSPGVTVDPRITITPHLQVNSNVFATPPVSLNPRQRQQADLGYVAARFTNSRSEGLNSLSYTYSFRDALNQVAAKTASGSTFNQGSQDGWGGLLAWDSGLPGGSWVNTVSLFDGSGTQVMDDTSSTYTLLAVDPRIATIVGAGSSGNQSDHFSPGSSLIIGASFINRSTGVGITPDTGSVRCAIARLNLATGRREYLDAAGNWTVFPTAEALTFHNMRTSPTDSLAFVFEVGPGKDINTSTSAWATFDIVCLATMTLNGTPYGGSTIATVLGEHNKHSAQKFDPTGLFS